MIVCVYDFLAQQFKKKGKLLCLKRV